MLVVISVPALEIAHYWGVGCNISPSLGEIAQPWRLLIIGVLVVISVPALEIAHYLGVGCNISPSLRDCSLLGCWL